MIEEQIIKKITIDPKDARKMIASLNEEDRASVIDAALYMADVVNAILAAALDEEETRDNAEQ